MNCTRCGTPGVESSTGLCGKCNSFSSQLDSTRIPHKCPVCMGVGKVYTNITSYSEYYPTAECPACNGTCIVWEDSNQSPEP